MNWKYISVVIILAFLIGVGILIQKYWSLDSQENDLVLFEEREAWGPCDTPEGCYQATKLYYSGKLVLEGERKNMKKRVSKEIIEEVINKIRTSGIMDKDCSIPFTTAGSDFVYTINLDNRTKQIMRPGCLELIQEIQRIFITAK